ncbi:hypothetical protein Holit_00954 [Hollandina sp. SP2]
MKKERKNYDEYIKRVKSIVENYGGTYMVKSEKITFLNNQWKPDRLIIIKFPSKEYINKCFSSPEYKAIENLRKNTVVSNAIIVEE